MRNNSGTKRDQKGFSLIELLVVVAIILVIAAIAVPNLLRAKTAANQSAAIASLRTVTSAENVYRADKTPATYDTLSNLAANGQLDSSWTTAVISATGHDGYTLAAIAAPTTDSFSFVALPVLYGKSGRNGYCVTEAASVHVIDGSSTAPSAPSDAAACMALPILGQ